MKTKVEIIRGDITRIPVDAMVNAANSRLAGGGGVDGAIHRAGGPAIMEELNVIRQKQGGCPTGEAVVTGAGKLPARKVIHAVGPVWTGGNQNERELLALAYRNSLLRAVETGARIISFPNISTGIYGFPKKEAAKIALKTIFDFINEHPDAFDKILLVCFDEENENIYHEEMKKYPVNAKFSNNP
ncbi:MAG: O-acetyl-ADP-ribose deacetylase [Bacteroidia bacterium]|nr:O-acetyl-ADP-ribose deacetylase [Bacteroidia bacterium]